jgi:hypothetical protein
LDAGDRIGGACDVDVFRTEERDEVVVKRGVESH